MSACVRDFMNITTIIHDYKNVNKSNKLQKTILRATRLSRAN